MYQFPRFSQKKKGCLSSRGKTYTLSRLFIQIYLLQRVGLCPHDITPNPVIVVITQILKPITKQSFQRFHNLTVLNLCFTGAKIEPFRKSAKRNYLFLRIGIIFLTFVKKKAISSDILFIYKPKYAGFSFVESERRRISFGNTPSCFWMPSAICRDRRQSARAYAAYGYRATARELTVSPS